MAIKKRREHNGTFIFSFSIINNNNFNMGREVMFTINAMIKAIAKATAKDKAKKTKAKKGVFFKNKKIAKNAEDMFTKMMGEK
jgi:hypothetical protein